MLDVLSRSHPFQYCSDVVIKPFDLTLSTGIYILKLQQKYFLQNICYHEIESTLLP